MTRRVSEKLSRMVEREEGKTVLAPEVGRAYAKALSQGDGEFEKLKKKKANVSLVGQAKDFRYHLYKMGIHGSNSSRKISLWKLCGQQTGGREEARKLMETPSAVGTVEINRVISFRDTWEAVDRIWGVKEVTEREESGMKHQ